MAFEDSIAEDMESTSMDAENAKVGEQKTSPKKKQSASNKPHRKRKRRYFNEIREQMEFYFGDANLTKDRFLKQLIDKDPFVPLDVFLTFNKMKVLAKDVNEIAKSLSNSQLLELDETQSKVRRKTALPAERDVDDKTLYVESIPPTADHDWVKENFERFGKVAYVSLPKYAKSRKIKEFGFIEFEKQESVGRAVRAFQEFKGVLSMQETDPAELKSIKAFIKEQNMEQDSAVEAIASERERKQENKKRKNKENPIDEGPIAKRIKKDDADYIASSSGTEDETSSEEEEKSSAGSATETATALETAAGDAIVSDSGKKKRRKKKKKSKNTKRNTDQDNDANFFDLKVLPKRDWKRLRNKYLNLQREKVAELKRKAWRAAQQHSRENLSDNIDSTAGAPHTPAKKSKPNERKLQKMKMNFYGAGDADTNEQNTTNRGKETKANPALERAPLFNYAPGLIVEVSFLEPCVAIKEFKADMRQYATVKYVDVKEGAMQAYLRLESASASEDLMRQIGSAEYKCKQLSGETEAEYWHKIEQDREMKLNKKVKVPQRRGREKVKKLLTKHIRFGDEDETPEQREV